MIKKRIQIKKAALSPAFWISAGLFIFCSFITLNANLKIDNIKSVANSNLDMFFYSVMYLNIIINSIAPLFAVIAASSIIYSKTPTNSISGFKNSFIASGVVGGSVFIISELIMIIILSTVYPLSFYINANKSGTFQMLMDNSFIYLLGFMVNSFLIGCFYSMLGYSVSFNNKKIYGIMVPFLIYNARIYYPINFETIFTYILSIDSYDIASKSRNIWSHIISLMFVGVLALIIAIYKTYKIKRSITNE